MIEYFSNLHAISRSQISVYQSFLVKILGPFSSLKSHLDDALGGKSPGGTFAAEFASDQKPLHISVPGVWIQKERSASVLDRNTENRKKGGMAEPVESKAFMKQQGDLKNKENLTFNRYI